MVTTEGHRLGAQRLLDLLATYRESEDLINIGAYVKGSNPRIDQAIGMINNIRSFLRQRADERERFENGIQQLQKMMGT